MSFTFNGLKLKSLTMVGLLLMMQWSAGTLALCQTPFHLPIYDDKFGHTFIYLVCYGEYNAFIHVLYSIDQCFLNLMVQEPQD